MVRETQVVINRLWISHLYCVDKYIYFMNFNKLYIIIYKKNYKYHNGMINMKYIKVVAYFRWIWICIYSDLLCFTSMIADPNCIIIFTLILININKCWTEWSFFVNTIWKLWILKFSSNLIGPLINIKMLFINFIQYMIKLKYIVK